MKRLASKPLLRGSYSTTDLMKFTEAVWYCGRNNIQILRNWNHHYSHVLRGDSFGHIVVYDLEMLFKSQKQYKCFKNKFG